eukprot:TRINITY_DN18346_c0_g2_i1.p1 TRINITY_DN18346_c0_g2~~TRINITY_DN18346_c0_g2_i1.p1  ORF type:complete len:281 (+),score=43.57 TRINITY_DN18346_c0_g2_i1:65-907(+)
MCIRDRKYSANSSPSQSPVFMTQRKGYIVVQTDVKIAPFQRTNIVKDEPIIKMQRKIHHNNAQGLRPRHKFENYVGMLRKVRMQNEDLKSRSRSNPPEEINAKAVKVPEPEAFSPKVVRNLSERKHEMKSRAHVAEVMAEIYAERDKKIIKYLTDVKEIKLDDQPIIQSYKYNETKATEVPIIPPDIEAVIEGAVDVQRRMNYGNPPHPPSPRSQKKFTFNGFKGSTTARSEGISITQRGHSAGSPYNSARRHGKNYYYHQSKMKAVSYTHLTLPTIYSV